MYCTNCGKELTSGNFCIYCGAKVPSAEVPATPAQVNNFRTNTPAPANNKKRNFIVIGSVSALCVVLAILIFGGHDKTPPMPGGSNANQPYDYNAGSDYYSAGDPFSSSGDYSYSYPDYGSDDTTDTYDYGASTQTCTACFGSGSCSICHGTGQYSMYGTELSPCTACGGTGICSICGGDGVY